MNKKIIALLLVVALASTGAVFAKTGLGIQGGYTVGGFTELPTSHSLRTRQARRATSSHLLV